MKTKNLKTAMKKVCFQLAVFLCCTEMYAQPVLTARHHVPRDGDEIIKQQVAYKDPGRSGEHVLWDFSRLETVNDAYSLQYLLRTDSLLAGIEHHTMYLYELSGDSLLGWGFENPTTLMRHSQPEVWMKYPLAYGDSTVACFQGKGKYSDHLAIHTYGTVSSKADAYGVMILPDKDTLRNVLRVNTVKRIAEKSEPIIFFESPEEIFPGSLSPDSMMYHLYNDSVILCVETNRWYMRGYRYPVFETVKTTASLPEDRQQDVFEVAFFYPPQEHYYLWNDPANLALWEEGRQEEEYPEFTGDPFENFNYNIYPNPVTDFLTLEYHLPQATAVQVSLHDFTGRIREQSRQEHAGKGIHMLQIYMGGYEKGNYLLTITTPELTISETILKK